MTLANGFVRLSPSCAKETVCRSVERTADGQAAALQDMGVDHRRPDVFVPQQFLDCSDVIMVFQQVGREAMAEGVARHALFKSSGACCGAHRFLQIALVKMMASYHAGARVRRKLI